MTELNMLLSGFREKMSVCEVSNENPFYGTALRGLSYKKRRFKRPKVWDVWDV